MIISCSFSIKRDLDHAFFLILYLYYRFMVLLLIG